MVIDETNAFGQGGLIHIKNGQLEDAGGKFSGWNTTAIRAHFFKIDYSLINHLLVHMSDEDHLLVGQAFLWPGNRKYHLLIHVQYSQGDARSSDRRQVGPVFHTLFVLPLCIKNILFIGSQQEFTHSVMG